MTTQQVAAYRDLHRRQYWRSATPLSNFGTSLNTSIFDQAPFFALLSQLATYCLALMSAIALANLIFTDDYGWKESLAVTIVYMLSGLALQKVNHPASTEAHNICASPCTKPLKLPGKLDLTTEIPVDNQPFIVYPAITRGQQEATDAAQGPDSSTADSASAPDSGQAASQSRSKGKGKASGKADPTADYQPDSDNDGQPVAGAAKKRRAAPGRIGNVAGKKAKLAMQATPTTAHNLDFDNLDFTRDESTAQINRIPPGRLMRWSTSCWQSMAGTTLRNGSMVIRTR